MNRLKIIIFVTLAASGHQALGDTCPYNGKLYPVGSTLGELTCQPDGSWQ